MYEKKDTDPARTEYYIVPARYTPGDTEYGIEPLPEMEFNEKRVLLTIDKDLDFINLSLYYHCVKDRRRDEEGRL